MERRIESEILHSLQLELSRLLQDENDDHNMNNAQNLPDEKKTSFPSTLMASIEDLIECSYMDGEDSSIGVASSIKNNLGEFWFSEETNQFYLFFLIILFFFQEKLRERDGEKTTHGHSDSKLHLAVRNEFAAELLYLMKTSMELC